MEQYELWVAGDTIDTRQRLFVRADENGDRLRKKLPEDAFVEWTVEAKTYYHAMVEYWKHMGLGEYTAVDHIFPGDELLKEPEPEDD